MARLSVRYLTSRPGPAGELPRWFWQPSTALRKQGWTLQRVPVDWRSYSTARTLEAAAVARAMELNELLDAARAEADAAPAPASLTHTLGELVALYQASDDWKALAPRTQQGYRQCFGKLKSRYGVAVRRISPVWVQDLKKELSATPSYANSVLRVLRLLLAFGRRQGWLLHNPAERPGVLPTEGGSLIWPAAAVDAFVKAADAMGHWSVGTAVLLNEWLAQREDDILSLPRDAIRNGALHIHQSKTGAGVTLPFAMVSRLADRVADELERHATREAAGAVPADTLLICEGTGRPWRESWFRHVFGKVRARAAETTPSFEIDYLPPGRTARDPDAFVVCMEDLTFMLLRHTGVTRLAEAQCEPALIAAISGHAEASVLSIIERYRIRTAKMARTAFQRRLDAEGSRA